MIMIQPPGSRHFSLGGLCGHATRQKISTINVQTNELCVRRGGLHSQTCHCSKLLFDAGLVASCAGENPCTFGLNGLFKPTLRAGQQLRAPNSVYAARSQRAVKQPRSRSQIPGQRALSARNLSEIRGGTLAGLCYYRSGKKRLFFPPHHNNTVAAPKQLL